jgi:hypothetical protein
MKSVYDAIQYLILIEEEQSEHEGYECGTGHCTEQCVTNVTVAAHNDAVMFLKSMYGKDNH